MEDKCKGDKDEFMLMLKYELIHLREKCETSGSSAHLSDSQFFKKTKLLKEEILQQQHIFTDMQRILHQ